MTLLQHGAGYLIFMIPFLIIGLVILIIWIKTIIEIANSDFEGDNKLIWLLIVLLCGILGLILYYILGRQKRILPENNSEEVIDDAPRYQK